MNCPHCRQPLTLIRATKKCPRCKENYLSRTNTSGLCRACGVAARNRNPQATKLMASSRKYKRELLACAPEVNDAI